MVRDDEDAYSNVRPHFVNSTCLHHVDNLTHNVYFEVYTRGVILKPRATTF